MPKKVILLRHAEAEFPSLSNKDITRPLTARGLEEAGRMAQRLSNLGGAPDKILCSPATRTMQTAEIFMKFLQTRPEQQEVDEGLYNAPASFLWSRLLEALGKETVSEVLVVAHNPGISQLAYQLSGEQAEGMSAFAPGSFAMFEVAMDGRKAISKKSFSLRQFEVPY